MGFPTVRILSVAFVVLGLILMTTCCAIPSWIVMSFTRSGIPILEQFGPWKMCAGTHDYQKCGEYGSQPSPVPVQHGIRAMTFFSCLLAYLSVLVLLLLGFGSCFIPFLQNEETKPKIRLAVGVGLLLAGILLIISLWWFPQRIKEALLVYKDEYSTSSGAGIYVGWLAGVLLLMGGVLLCLFRKMNIP